MDTLNSLSKEVSGENQHSVDEQPSRRNAFADLPFVVEPGRRGGWWQQLLLPHAGGYDPKYYTSEEAKDSTVLAFAKFASVTLATFAFMKAIAPTFESQALLKLQDETRFPLQVSLFILSAACFWWAVSKLDTAVLHGMRAEKIGKYISENFHILKSQPKGAKALSILLRISISIGSLGITIPALLVAMSEKTVDNHIKKELDARNAPLVQEYKMKLSSADDYLESLRTKQHSVQESLRTEAPDSRTNINANERIKELAGRVKILEMELAAMLNEKSEQEQRRDDAKGRMDQEEKGTRGSRQGQGPKYRDAEADYNDILRALERLAGAEARKSEEIRTAKEEMATIIEAERLLSEESRSTWEKSRSEQIAQLKLIENEINVNSDHRDAISNIDRLLRDDIRYLQFNPDLASKVDAYVSYMKTQANFLEWCRAFFTILMITSIEIGVFVLASTRQPNSGEMRAFLAGRVKSEESSIVYKRVSHGLSLKEEIVDDEETIKMRKRRDLIQTDSEMFDKALASAKSSPSLYAQVQKSIAEFLQRLSSAGFGK